MLANGIIQTTVGTGSAGANLTLSAVSGMPTFAAKFSTGSNGDSILFAVKRKDSGAFLFSGIGHLSDSTTLVIDRTLTTWDGSAEDDTSPSAIALASGVDYYVYPVMEAGAMLGAWPTIIGDIAGAADSKRLLLGPGAGAVLGGGTVALSANVLYQWPSRWSCMDTLKRLYAAVTTAGTNLRIGVWAMRHDGGRGRLLADSGSLSGASTTLVGASVTEIRPAAHGCWVGVMADAAITVRGFVPNDPGALGWTISSTSASAGYGSGSRTFSSGLPDPLPAPTTLQTGAGVTVPAVWGGV
jgi:hypothetical protein